MGMRIKLIFAFFAGLKPEPKITVREWADTYRVLPSEGSAEPGRYRTSRMPYLAEIADEASPQSPTQKISVVKGVQLGFTEFANNIIFTYADLYPCPMLFILPTESLAITHAKDKIWPSIEKTPRMKEKIYPRKKDGGSSLLDIRFPGGNVKIAYSFTPSTFASVSRRVVIKDDLDRWSDNIKGEGDPSSLADKRTDAFPNKKIFANSSPTLEGKSKIWREYLSGSQAIYEMPCPECGEYFAFEKERFSYEWDKEEYGLLSSVVCICPHCEAKIRESKKNKMMQHGRWVHKYPKRKHKSYRIPSYYSPFLPWDTIFEEYLLAKQMQDIDGLDEKMIVWENTRNAKPWSEQTTEYDESELLTLRVSIPPETLPQKTVALTMGVDVQSDHFWYEIRAWQEGGGWHVADYGRLADWTDLENVMQQDYFKEDGTPMYIRLTGIDSGYRTDEVYEFCKLHPSTCIPVKGVDSTTMSSPWRENPVERKINGRRKKIGLKLYGVNVLYYKNAVDSKLKRSMALAEKEQLENSEGVITFHEETDDTLAIHYSSEYLERETKRNGSVIYRWVAKERNPKNHLWDCAVYNTFLGDLIGVKRLKANSKNRMEKPSRPRRRRVVFSGVRRRGGI